MTHASTQDLLIARIRVRARLLTRWMERLWAEERSSPDQGLVITAAEGTDQDATLALLDAYVDIKTRGLL